MIISLGIIAVAGSIRSIGFGLLKLGVIMFENQEITPSAKELAMQRTEWAFKRTRLANERTLIAWLRTGLAMTGFGAVVPRLLINIDPEWLVDLIAALFVIVGGVTVIVGIRVYRQTTGTIPDVEESVPWWVMASLAGVIQIGAVAMLILFILD
jgi:putative membrane protein